MKITVTNNENGLTIRQYMERLGFSSRMITRLKAKQRGIVVNSERKTVRYVLCTNDTLELETEDDSSSDTIPLSDIPINVLYEDDWFIAVEKSAHLPIHPSRRHTSNTLASRVMNHFKNTNFIFRVLTRLDLDTSGVVLIAKDAVSAAKFCKMLSERCVRKDYLAICDGFFKSKQGTIKYNIRRPDPYNIKREAVPEGDGGSENSPEGNTAITEYEVLREGRGVSLVRFTAVTGRTHQLRVHSAASGHPILSDTLYSVASPYIKRQALHAYKLCFTHPFTNKEICIVCPLPEDFTQCERELF